MLDIIMRAGSFVAIIAMGFSLKRIGFFRQEDFSLLAKISVRITLPCAIITSFAGKAIDPALLSLAAFSIICGAVYLAAGYLMNTRRGRDRQAFEMLNLAGYNIGCFALPFAQGFLGPMGVIAVSIFDTGNALVCLGGAFALACMVKDGSGFSFRRIGGALIRSVPFMTYVIMLSMNLLSLSVPAFVLSVANVGANANAFMAMLMIGVGFRLEANRAQLGAIARILLVRYGFAALFACVFYFLLPFEPDVRQALVILAFAPIGSAVPAFTSEMKGDVGLASAINSIEILISISVIVGLLMVML